MKTSTRKRRGFGKVRLLPSGRWQAGYRRDGRTVYAPDTFETEAAGDRWLHSQRLALSGETRADELAELAGMLATISARLTELAGQEAA